MHPRHRHKTKTPPNEVELGKIITPMLDMSFQLLSFFVFTFHPVPIEGQMTMNLPALKDTSASKAPPTDVPELEPPTNLTVTIREAGGGIGGLVLKTDSTNEDLGTDPARLAASLKQVRKGLPPGQDSVKIETSGKLRYSCLVEVMDACIEAGFPGVGFAKPLD
jgi:biopolymer transport protein ExbD